MKAVFSQRYTSPKQSATYPHQPPILLSLPIPPPTIQHTQHLASRRAAKEGTPRASAPIEVPRSSSDHTSRSHAPLETSLRVDIYTIPFGSRVSSPVSHCRIFRGKWVGRRVLCCAGLGWVRYGTVRYCTGKVEQSRVTVRKTPHRIPFLDGDRDGGGHVEHDKDQRMQPLPQPSQPASPPSRATQHSATAPTKAPFPPFSSRCLQAPHAGAFQTLHCLGPCGARKRAERWEPHRGGNEQTNQPGAALPWQQDGYLSPFFQVPPRTSRHAASIRDPGGGGGRGNRVWAVVQVWRCERGAATLRVLFGHGDVGR